MIQYLEIEISDPIKESTHKIAQKRNMKMDLPTNNYWCGTPGYQNYIGILGEQLVKKYFDDNKVVYSYDDDFYYDHGDSFDFEIKGKRVDVKTGHLTWPIEDLQPGYRFFIPEHQINKYFCDFYINVQLSQIMDYGYLFGWIPYKHTFRYPIVQTVFMVSPARAIPLVDLKPINELLEEIEK